ncbi:MAG: SulP family inorganic anion transporter [Burkholderiaceae bacterium]|nr:SulP family inorganic anion transporter [Burkholderiaceae bacterium]
MVELARFHPRLLDTLKGYDRQRFIGDLTAGITVGVIALPLAMAFGIASGVKPEQGILTAIIGGFLVAALGGSNIQIGGPAGAFIVIVYGIVERYGLTNLLISTALAGMLLFAMGALKLGGLVRYVPVSIVIGFTNGIAVLIALSQVKDLLGLSIAKMPSHFFAQLQAIWQHIGSVNPTALALGATCLGGLFLWARLFSPGGLLPVRLLEGRTVRGAARLPGSIVALVSLSIATALFNLPVETIGSRFGGIPTVLPSLALPDFSWQSAQQLFIPTITIAMLGAVESLLCARVADNLTTLPRHDPNQELMAQGVANMVVPMFGGIPVTGTIARTVTNVRSGANSPVSGIVHALTLLAIVLVAAPLAVHVPLAALAGILLFVAFNMGEWHEFARLRQFSAGYRTILLGTFFLTVIFDLTVAIEIGLVLSCVFFIYRMSTLFQVQPAADDAQPTPPGVVLFNLYGALFFGAVTKVESLADKVPDGSHAMVLDLHRLVLMDTSGLDAMVQLHRSLARKNVRLVLCRVNEQPLSLVRRAGFESTLGARNLHPDLPSALAAAAAANP